MNSGLKLNSQKVNESGLTLILILSNVTVKCIGVGGLTSAHSENKNIDENFSSFIGLLSPHRAYPLFVSHHRLF